MTQSHTKEVMTKELTYINDLVSKSQLTYHADQIGDALEYPESLYPEELIQASVLRIVEAALEESNERHEPGNHDKFGCPINQDILSSLRQEGGEGV